MRLKLDILEARDTPSFLGARDGSVYMPFDNDFVPFSDFKGLLNTAATDQNVLVGAGNGGGPRVQLRDFNDTTITKLDQFVFESSFRNGVNVAVGSNFFAVGAGVGGGPVVAVYDLQGIEISRFFAYDSEFRGGVNVAITDDGNILTLPGQDGGPLLRSFDKNGTEIGSGHFGDGSDLRQNWKLTLGDVTGDGVSDIIVSGDNGRVTINEGVTGGKQTVQMPQGFNRLAYSADSMTVGNDFNFQRESALWTAFPTLVGFRFSDGAAGNGTPPQTTGIQPGTYTRTTTGSDPLSDKEITNFTTIYGSDSVGSIQVGTGSSFQPMMDSTGQQYLVTASHVVRKDPHISPSVNGELNSPGAIDGLSLPAGSFDRISTITQGVPYQVDAVAYKPFDNITLNPLVRFGSETLKINEIVTDAQIGDTLLAVGRGKFIGMGNVLEFQTDPQDIRWPDGSTQQINNQIIGIRGVIGLAVPGFSGGDVLRLRWTDQGVVVGLIGMTVAGNDEVVYITPVQAIQDVLHLTSII